MNLLSDTTSASALETLKCPLNQSSRGAGSEQATKPTEAQVITEFQRLLDSPDRANINTETALVESAHTLPLDAAAENTLETAIEASAWLALDAPTEAIPAMDPAVNAISLTVPTRGRALDGTDILTDPIPSTGEALFTPTPIPLEAVPQGTMQAVESTPITAISNAPITEMLTSNLPSITFNSISLPLFSPPEPALAPSSLPLPNVHRPEFAQGIAIHLTWLASQSIGQAHIQINPPHLGAVNIKLHLHDQQLHAAFFSPHNEVCQRLQENLPTLHRLLNEQGLHLTHAEISQQTPHSPTDSGTAKTPLSAVVNEHHHQSDTTEETPLLVSQHYSITSLLDTWA